MAISTAVDKAAENLTRLRFLFVNLYFHGTADEWVLIDAGLQGSKGSIVSTAEDLFGKSNPPRAVILTHGHFDHVGAFPELFDTWNVPVYAHPLEMPFLTGRGKYPPADPMASMGAMALLSLTYPTDPIDLGPRVRALPDDGTVPGMPGWKVIHVPGHTPGQVAFFRESDRCLIAGDAFVTTEQEALYAVATQKEEVHGPPVYFTPDWIEARRSVERLAALRPAIAATGHGTPMRGEELRNGLEELVARFDELAVPKRGRYAPERGTTR